MKKIKALIYATALGAVMFLSGEVASRSKPAPSDPNVVVLTSDNVVVLNGEVTGDSVGQVLLRVKTLDKKTAFGKNKKPLYLFMHTPGGEIQSGLEMLQALHGIGRPINTVTNFAASMGFQIVQNLGSRLILRNGVLMSHRAAGGFEGSFGGQGPSQLDNRYALWLSRINDMDEQTVRRTKGKQTLQSYQKQYDNEMWLTAEQSVAQGYADKVVDARCDESLDGVTTKTAAVLGMELLYDMDNCPLNTSPMNIRANITTKDGKVVTVKNFLEMGGQFGASCYELAATNKSQVCALDPTLTIEKINTAIVQFKDSKTNLQNHVVPMRF